MRGGCGAIYEYSWGFSPLGSWHVTSGPKWSRWQALQLLSVMALAVKWVHVKR